MTTIDQLLRIAFCAGEGAGILKAGKRVGCFKDQVPDTFDDFLARPEIKYLIKDLKIEKSCAPSNTNA